MLRKRPWSVKNQSADICLVVRRHDCYNAFMNDRVRTSIAAGRFYPSEPDQLRKQIIGFLGNSSSIKHSSLSSAMGLVVPHAGYVYSGSVAGAGYMEVASRGRPEVIVILGASHTGIDPWFSLSPHTAWATPLGRSPVDAQMVSHLVSSGFRQAEEAPFAQEHSIEVQLPFIQHLWGLGTAIVPICIGPAPLSEIQEAARALAMALGERKGLIIASSDFTHYESHDVARSLDAKALDRILALDVPGFHSLCRNERLTICGTGAIEVLMMVANSNRWTATRTVSYATSGDVTGDLSSVVGYASVVLTKENYG